MMETIDQKKNWYLSNFEVFEKSLNGEATSHIHTIRKSAISRFVELGFPTTHDEEWKYTDVAPLANVPFTSILGYPADGLVVRDIEQFALGKGNRLVCVNGHFSKDLSSISSLPAGVTMGSLAVALRNDSALVEQHLTRYARYDDNAFTALSTAFLRDGVFVAIPDGIILEEPIQLLFIATGPNTEFVSHPRNLILVGKNSQVSIVESYVNLTNNTYFTNAVSEIALGENAVLEHEKFQNESSRSFHIGTLQVHQDRSSNFISNSISFGGALVRNNITSVLDGDGSECTLNGLYVVTGDQHIDNHTTIDHAKPHCGSHELYKGILAGKSKGVFNGKIIVRKDAQKTDAKQTNKNLVLSDEAVIDTKPQLEIFANDVKCTHGATVGQLDDEAIFYLRSRGIGARDAQDILISAFANDVMNRIKVEPLRNRLREILHERLEQERQARKE